MDSGYAPLNDKTRAWILAAAKNDEDSLRRLLNENPEIYRHSSISAVNVGTHTKKTWKQKPHKSRLRSSTKREDNMIELSSQG